MSACGSSLPSAPPAPLTVSAEAGPSKKRRLETPESSASPLKKEAKKLKKEEKEHHQKEHHQKEHHQKEQKKGKEKSHKKKDKPAKSNGREEVLDAGKGKRIPAPIALSDNSDNEELSPPPSDSGGSTAESDHEQQLTRWTKSEREQWKKPLPDPTKGTTPDGSYETERILRWRRRPRTGWIQYRMQWTKKAFGHESNTWEPEGNIAGSDIDEFWAKAGPRPPDLPPLPRDEDGDPIGPDEHHIPNATDEELESPDPATRRAARRKCRRDWRVDVFWERHWQREDSKARAAQKKQLEQEAEKRRLQKVKKDSLAKQRLKNQALSVPYGNADAGAQEKADREAAIAKRKTAAASAPTAANTSLANGGGHVKPQVSAPPRMNQPLASKNSAATTSALPSGTANAAPRPTFKATAPPPGRTEDRATRLPGISQEKRPDKGSWKGAHKTEKRGVVDMSIQPQPAPMKAFSAIFPEPPATAPRNASASAIATRPPVAATSRQASDLVSSTPSDRAAAGPQPQGIPTLGTSTNRTPLGNSTSFPDTVVPPLGPAKWRAPALAQDSGAASLPVQPAPPASAVAQTAQPTLAPAPALGPAANTGALAGPSRTVLKSALKRPGEPTQQSEAPQRQPQKAGVTFPPSPESGDVRKRGLQRASTPGAADADNRLLPPTESPASPTAPPPYQPPPPPLSPGHDAPVNGLSARPDRPTRSDTFANAHSHPALDDGARQYAHPTANGGATSQYAMPPVAPKSWDAHDPAAPWAPRPHHPVQRYSARGNDRNLPVRPQEAGIRQYERPALPHNGQTTPMHRPQIQSPLGGFGESTFASTPLRRDAADGDLERLSDRSLDSSRSDLDRQQHSRPQRQAHHDERAADSYKAQIQRWDPGEKLVSRITRSYNWAMPGSPPELLGALAWLCKSKQAVYNLPDRMPSVEKWMVPNEAGEYRKMVVFVPDPSIKLPKDIAAAKGMQHVYFYHLTARAITQIWDLPIEGPGGYAVPSLSAYVDYFSGADNAPVFQSRLGESLVFHPWHAQTVSAFIEAGCAEQLLQELLGLDESDALDRTANLHDAISNSDMPLIDLENSERAVLPRSNMAELPPAEAARLVDDDVVEALLHSQKTQVHVRMHVMILGLASHVSIDAGITVRSNFTD
ncbi:hypothetical protein IE81DRAFT_321352 [Ceraceosorus guamensis]|uniref:Chromo domain-containing protein n=1 Tax=Ceraceosorus guamensis TaxID=1522189 RepID=A0A316W3K3_9BASI|nr:hypothetical protein IE81DRAFT_321352 [Ceraceosorus guamensis]PWN44456.1 hypothetical protein IE81DRAFT_321352 [Ceraceosorus guamensis]